MDLAKYNEAIDYIEKNLIGDIDLDKAGAIAGCSGYHFSKIFFVSNRYNIKKCIFEIEK